MKYIILIQILTVTSIMFTLQRENIQLGPEKSVHIQNREDFTKEGVKTSKNRSGGPESVQYNRLFIKEGCSLTEVLLYMGKMSFISTQRN